MTLASNGLANAIPFRFTYADAAARAAASGFTSADLYSLALQLDNATVWILTATTPTWTAAAGTGMTNPMTTAGDIIIGDTGGAAIRKAKGADSTILTIDASTHLPVWAAPAASGALAALHDETLGSDTTTLTYSPPGSGYRDLILRVEGRTDEASGHSALKVQLNADTGGNYSDILYDVTYSGSSFTGTHTVLGELAVAYVRAGYLPGTSGPANTEGYTEIVIPNYLDATFHQVLHVRSASKAGTATTDMVRAERDGWWANVAAVTQVDLNIVTAAKKFKTGTRFTVWGVKAS